MATIRNRSVNFNSVLMGLNFLVAGLIVSGYSSTQNNPYVDQETIALGILLSLQTQLALFVERRRRDPFVILLAFITIFYFSLRIFTLVLYPFRRHSNGTRTGRKIQLRCGIHNCVANCFLYAGFISVKFTRDDVIDSGNWRPVSPARVIMLMVVSIIYSYFSGIYWTPDELPRIASLVGIFVSPPIILLMALSYFILFRRSLSRKAAITIALLLTLEIVAHTLAGSRSGIATLVQNIMLVVLAISSVIRFKKSYFVLGLVSRAGGFGALDRHVCDKHLQPRPQRERQRCRCQPRD